MFLGLLQATINLINHIIIRIRRPIPTRLLHNQRNLIILTLNIRRPLQNIGIQPRTNMPGNMAMEWPNTWIIRRELHHHMSKCSNLLDISSLWVVGICEGCSVPVSRSFVQDLHVMTVEMHGVCSGSGVVYNDADRGVAAEVLDVPLCGVRKVALVGEKENRVVVVGAEGLFRCR
jgi:hypothetical protein